MTIIIATLANASVAIDIPDSTRLTKPAQFGKTLFTLVNGDFVAPCFSPDGKYLAFSQVIVKKDTEGTQILLINCTTCKVDTILPRKEAMRFAVYGTYVNGLRWRGNRALVATLHDGDVDSYDLTIDIAAKTYTYRHNEQERTRSAHDDALDSKLVRLHNDILDDYLRAARDRNSLYEIPSRGVLVQFHHAHRDNNLWFYSSKDTSSEVVLTLPDIHNINFSGGATIGNRTLYCVNYPHMDSVTIYCYDGIVNYSLLSVPSPNHSPVFQAKSTTGSPQWFQLIIAPPNQRADNPIFRFNGPSLRRYEESLQVYDFDISSTNQLVAICAWSGERRKIVIRKLTDRP